MNSKAVVLVIRATGNVLAAVSRVSQADSPLSALQLMGSDHSVRYLINDDTATTLAASALAQFNETIATEYLGAVVVDGAADLFKRPRRFAVADPSKDSSTVAAVTGSRGTISIALDANQIQVTITQKDDNKATPVWVQISGTPITEPVIAAFEIPKSAVTQPYAFGSPLPNGTYRVLAFLPDSKPYANNQNVP